MIRNVTAHPKEVPAVQVIKAAFGERMLTLKVRFWTEMVVPRAATRRRMQAGRAK